MYTFIIFVLLFIITIRIILEKKND
jgi:hypothetical protein